MSEKHKSPDNLNIKCSFVGCDKNAVHFKKTQKAEKGDNKWRSTSVAGWCKDHGREGLANE